MAWKPRIWNWVRLAQVEDVGGCGWLFPLTMVSTAPTMVAMPSVAMNAFTCRRTMMKPFTVPISTPMRSASAMAGHIGQCCCDWRMATTTALRFAVAPMLRSNAPVASGTTTASPRSAATACSEAIECTVLSVRKRWGSQIPKIRMNKAHRYRPLKRSNPNPGRLPIILMCPATFPGRGSPRWGKRWPGKTRGSTAGRGRTAPQDLPADGAGGGPPVPAHDHALADGGQFIDVRRTDHVGGACRGRLHQLGVQHGLGAHVHALRRLVEQEHRRLAAQPLGEHDLLLVAAAERLQGQVDQTRRPDAEPLEPAERGPALGPPPHRAEPAERPQAGQRDVFPSREAQDRRVPDPVRRQVGQAVPHGQVRPGRREPHTASGHHLAGPAGGPEGGAQHRFAA